MTPFDATSSRRTLFNAFLEARGRHGRGMPIIEDPERAPLTYDRLLLAALILGGKMRAISKKQEAVGILMPNMNGTVALLLGLSLYGRVPAMLNFTAGVRNLQAAARTAEIRTIVTSRRFVDTAQLQPVIDALETNEGDAAGPRRIVYLEDVRKSLTSLEKIGGVIAKFFAGLIHRQQHIEPDAPAIILFTSGSEGTPKAVVLSHANINANAGQIFQHAAGLLSSRDTIFNPLPVFHSFGLTAGLLTGLLNGIKVVLYPSPLHFKQIPKLIGETKSTILFATDTFLQSYARAADKDDLSTIRYVIAGAEKVRDETRRMWDKFGTVILEGYGCTECAPVIACNLPRSNTPGSVGEVLPGIEMRFADVEGLTDARRLSVRGPNVMLGYMHADAPGKIVPPEDGWHDTGDIVSIDNGLVSIRGRAKRFAKIGGEMISLAAVETLVTGIWTQFSHAVVTIPDPKKGEQIVLVTDKPDAERDALLQEARKQGYPELWVPRAILVVAALPVMGSGKIDYPAATEAARRLRSMI
ncbi:MAG: AMP-binding protein [Beijerinckiaceae bacterium]